MELVFHREDLSWGPAVRVFPPTEGKPKAMAGSGAALPSCTVCSSCPCTGNKHSQGSSHWHLPMDLILHIPQAAPAPRSGLRQLPPSSLCSHILPELSQSPGAAPHSPVYVRGLVERGVILLFAFPAGRERAGKSCQWGTGVLGCPHG